jgi:hypothetical protein
VVEKLAVVAPVDVTDGTGGVMKNTVVKFELCAETNDGLPGDPVSYWTVTEYWSFGR